MKKSLIAIAALAAVGAATAQQSSVTMYGLLDTAYSYEKKTSTDSAGNKTTVRSTGFRHDTMATPRVGFKGQESLGNGLSAVFALEMGFNSADGSTATGFSGFNRRSVVGLKGDFGEVLIGRDSTPLNVWDDEYQAIGATIDEVGIRTRVTGLFYNGTFDGLTVNALVGYDETDKKINGIEQDGTGHSSGYGLGLHYRNGGFGLGAVLQGFDTSATKSPNNPEYGVGVFYDFTGAKIFAHAFGTRTKLGEGWKQNRDQYAVGIAVPFGATTLSAEYAYNHFKEKFPGDSSESADGHDFAVQAKYAFSKRTSTFIRFAQVDALKTNNSLRKTKTDVFRIGVQHKF